MTLDLTGVAVGEPVGWEVGDIEGRIEGLEEGWEEGGATGTTEGCDEGREVGWDDGATVGWRVGSKTLGRDVGTGDGKNGKETAVNGAAVGCPEGCWDGSSVGKRGSLVGIELGIAVEIRFLDGDAVGCPVCPTADGWIVGGAAGTLVAAWWLENRDDELAAVNDSNDSTTDLRCDPEPAKDCDDDCVRPDVRSTDENVGCCVGNPKRTDSLLDDRDCTPADTWKDRCKLWTEVDMLRWIAESSKENILDADVSAESFEDIATADMAFVDSEVGTCEEVLLRTDDCSFECWNDNSELEVAFVDSIDVIEVEMLFRTTDWSFERRDEGIELDIGRVEIGGKADADVLVAGAESSCENSVETEINTGSGVGWAVGLAKNDIDR
jgi:hypothetical protein